jgi:hypothetical protein
MLRRPADHSRAGAAYPIFLSPNEGERSAETARGA